VTIASPHAGVPWKGPILGEVGTQLRQGCAYLEDRTGHTIAVPTLSIYSTHDNMVHPPETSQLAPRGGRDLAIEGVGHLAILFDRNVIDGVRDFLREPANERAFGLDVAEQTRSRSEAGGWQQRRRNDVG
jgi:hypothetical protein